jgi:hypothetical protein
VTWDEAVPSLPGSFLGNYQEQILSAAENGAWYVKRRALVEPHSNYSNVTATFIYRWISPIQNAGARSMSSFRSILSFWNFCM